MQDSEQLDDDSIFLQNKKQIGLKAFQKTNEEKEEKDIIKKPKRKNSSLKRQGSLPKING